MGQNQLAFQCQNLAAAMLSTTTKKNDDQNQKFISSKTNKKSTKLKTIVFSTSDWKIVQQPCVFGPCLRKAIKNRIFLKVQLSKLVNNLVFLKVRTRNFDRSLSFEIAKRSSTDVYNENAKKKMARPVRPGLPGMSGQTCPPTAAKTLSPRAPESRLWKF